MSNRQKLPAMTSTSLSRLVTLDRVLFVGLLIAVLLTFPPLATPTGWQQSFATYVHAIHPARWRHYHNPVEVLLHVEPARWDRLRRRGVG